MRVALFFDGKNFYSGWRDVAQGRRIDFPRLAEWLVRRVHGSTLWGASYYTGIEVAGGELAEPQQRLTGFLDMLETQPGYFVHRFPRKQMKSSCGKCGSEARYTTEKEVDTTMVVDMMRYAAVNAFDIAVLMSGDADYAPALEGVRAVGKQAYIASWAGAGVSERVRKVAFEHIDLVAGLPHFSREGDGEPSTVDDPAKKLQTFIDELTVAQERFSGGYVGLGYFLMKWRSPVLDASSDARRVVLDALVATARVEVYEAPDGAQAIRVVPAAS
jgi:uncharacterized LabA/DUF88 family protein